MRLISLFLAKPALFDLSGERALFAKNGFVLLGFSLWLAAAASGPLGTILVSSSESNWPPSRFFAAAANELCSVYLATGSEDSLSGELIYSSCLLAAAEPASPLSAAYLSS